MSAVEGVTSPADRLRLALELTDLGLRLAVQRYRREHPSASGEEIEAFTQSWWRHRPGAEHGDASGPFTVRPIPPSWQSGGC